MRILVCNRFERQLGGVESYLNRVMPALAAESHEVALLSEDDSSAQYPPLPFTGPAWLVAELGLSSTLRSIRQWCPEIIYAHSMNDSGLEQALLETAPAVLFAHDYAATCISGAKRFAFPRTSWCSRQFGAACLLNYFPRRCGGNSPVTMWRNYHIRRARLELMHSYRYVLTASGAMRQEYLRHGFESGRVEVLHYPVTPASARTAANRSRPAGGRDIMRPADRADALHLLFAGRMVPLKGGDLLLQALPLTVAALRRPVRLIMAGEGPEKIAWEAHARAICARNPAIGVKFTGWLEHAALRELMAECDLLVVPSLWPEPFGMTGPEAGTEALPAAAFAVGGIPEWLHDGVNGFLAAAHPPSPAALAAAIVKCVANPLLYRQLCAGAQREAGKFSLPRHIARLSEVFARVAAEASASPKVQEAAEPELTSAVPPGSAGKRPVNVGARL